MDEKIYTPEVVAENPLPTADKTSQTQTSQSSTGDTYSPNKTTEQAFPVKKRAVELLSTSLNTRSRKILQEFDLEQAGGFQIGNFQEGITGDLRITPNGITARDISGDTTFAIDGTTGDAVFKGEVRASDFVVSDENGLVSLSNFRNGTVSAVDQQQTDSTSYVDLDSMILVTPNFSRETVVLILFTAQNQIYATTSGAAGGWSNNFIVNIDGTNDESMAMTKNADDGTLGYQHDGTNWTTNTMHYLSTLSPGQHIIKIQWKVINYSGAGTATTFRRTLSFSSLGS